MMPAQRLIAERQCFRHSQVERQLHETKMMPATGNFLRDLRDFRNLHGIPRVSILPEAVPCGHAVILNLAGFHC